MTIIYVFPAYVANAAPVVASRLIGRTHPIDRRSIFIDGRRLLGDGKTYEGLFSGVICGLFMGFILNFLLPPLFRGIIEILALVIGAVLGDIGGAFLKRRMGIPRGRAAPLLDQLGFLAGSLMLVAIAVGLPAWLDASLLLYIAVITLLLHVGTNAAAYFLGLKDRWY